VVDTPALPLGTRDVTLDKNADAMGAPETLRNLTLNANVGAVALPAGTYGALVINKGSTLVLGVEGATQPASYDLQSLTLNSGSRIEVVGPVVLTLAAGVSVSNATFSSHSPAWLTLKLASGGLTLNGDVSLPANVIAPGGAVTLNAKATLIGTVKADTLILNTDAAVETP
jgi:hypothetical protein